MKSQFMVRNTGCFLDTFATDLGSENTLQKLFDAQRANPQAEPIMSHDHPRTAQTAVAKQKSTLHAYWNIRQPQPLFTVPTQPEEALGARCEDCDRTIGSSSTMDIDMQQMDLDIACAECGRRICDFCAVNGDARRCLECVQERHC